MSPTPAHPADDDQPVLPIAQTEEEEAFVRPSYPEDEPPPTPWDYDAEVAERELNAPLADWEDWARPAAEQPVPQAPTPLVAPATGPGPLPQDPTPAPAGAPGLPAPAPKPHRTRQARLLGELTPLPLVPLSRMAAHWAALFCSLTTTSDLWQVLHVGINLLVELRAGLHPATPVGGLDRLRSAQVMRPVWKRPELREDVAGIAAVLGQEIAGLVEALELVPYVQRGTVWELMQLAQASMIRAHYARLGEMLPVLRKRHASGERCARWPRWCAGWPGRPS